MKTKKSNAYEGVLDRLRTTYSSSEDARDTSTEKSENPEEIIQEKGMLLTPGPAFRPRKYSYVPPEDTTRSEENGKKLNFGEISYVDSVCKLWFTRYIKSYK